MTIEKGELAIFVEGKKKKYNEIHLLGLSWERQTTLLIAFIFSVLVSSGSVYNASLKVYASQEILTVVTMSYYENIRLCKTHSSSSRVLFLVINFALSWPQNSLP